MAANARKRGKNWYVFVEHHGRRIARSVGASKQRAEQLCRELNARLVLGDLSIFGKVESKIPLFLDYGQTWLRQYADIECKPSTVAGYRSILETRLIPVFGKLPLDHITRNRVKDFLSDLAKGGLSRNTLRNTLCTLRVILNQAIEDGLMDRNPAAGWGGSRKVRSPNSRQLL